MKGKALKISAILVLFFYAWTFMGLCDLAYAGIGPRPITIVKSAYDKEGNLVETIDQEGRVTQSIYGPNKERLQTNYPDGTATYYGYDALGRQIAVIDALGNVTQTVYDSLGRRIKSISPDGAVWASGYDLASNVVAQTDPNGNKSTSVYDAAGQLIKTILPGGQTTQFEYDALGRKITETDAASNVTRFEYDAVGNLVKVTDAMVGITRYEYDANGNRTAIIDARSNQTTFVYDISERLVSKTMPNGGTETYAYDEIGRQTSKTDAKGQSIQYAYNSLGRLSKKSYPDGSGVQYTYTPTGSRSMVSDKRGATRYTYDLRNRMTKVTNPDGQNIGYAYDPKGRLTSISSLAGTIFYVYDSCCRLSAVRDPQGKATTFNYDAAGNRTGLAYPNGTNVTYSYDVNNRLTQLTHRGVSGVLASYAYTLGPIGNRIKIDEVNGISRQYQYDALYRLTSEQVSDPNNVQTYQTSCTYDAVGNRLKKTNTAPDKPVVSTDYTYNAADQLVSEKGITYTYDLNGNLISKTDGTGVTTYSYDYENRLTQIKNPNGEVINYRYDADGNRVEVSTATGTIRYLVDTNRSLSQVLAEYNLSGTLIAFYVYKDDLISMTRGGKTYYYYNDGLGSVRVLTDSTGTVTDTYDYDAFGNLINRTGNTENAFLFTGQQYDANVGFYYLRARHYQPTSGRFNSFDPYEGDPFTPVSLHKYLYAGADPVNKVDPSGWMYGSLYNYTIQMAIGALLTLAVAISFGYAVNETYRKLYEAGAANTVTHPEMNRELQRSSPLSTAVVKARARTQARVEEAVRKSGCRGNVLFHYTSTRWRAQQILISKKIFLSEPLWPGLPWAAYATDISPWENMTMRQLINIIYRADPRRAKNTIAKPYYVALCNDTKIPFIPVPDNIREWYKPDMEINPLLWGRNPMP